MNNDIIDVHTDYLFECLTEIEDLTDKLFAEPRPMAMNKQLLKDLFRMQYRWMIRLTEESEDLRQHAESLLFNNCSMVELIIDTDRIEFAEELRLFLANKIIPESAFK